jgi:hypothetical protein
MNKPHEKENQEQAVVENGAKNTAQEEALSQEELSKAAGGDSWEKIKQDITDFIYCQ